MINYGTFYRIKQFKKDGLNISQISRELNCDKKTISKWYNKKDYQPKQGLPQKSKLDPYKKMIISWLERYPYSARQIFQKLKETEYAGSYTTVKRYVRRVRPSQKSAFLSLNFSPGECAQVDWGSYKTVRVGSTRRKLYFFTMVLCYSRMIYVEFTLSQAMEFFLSAHINALKYFGGVPAKIMIDNLKTGVISHPFGEKPVFNDRYLEFAHHFGFSPIACGVRKPNEKGRVENGVGYVKKNFLNGLEISSFYALNPAIRIWMDEEANTRIHGETKKQPMELFKLEKPCLGALNYNPYDAGVMKHSQSSSRFRVSFETNRYSIPSDYASLSILMKVYAEKLLFFRENKLIAQHPRSFDRHQDFEDPDHLSDILRKRKNAREQKTFSRFLNLSPEAPRYLEKLKERKLNPKHHIQKIMALCEIYGKEKVGKAIEDGLYFGAYSCEYAANILEQRERTLDPPGELHLIRREDLLEIDLPSPALDIYETTNEEDEDEEKK